MAVEKTMGPEDAIAIVGIGGLFPGAETLDQFWSNIVRCVDSTSDVPPGRWLIEPEDVFDPRVGLEDHVYSKRGGFLRCSRLDPEGLELDGSLLEQLDPQLQLALYVAREAWRDAQTTLVDRGRVGVVFGNIVLPTETRLGALARVTEPGLPRSAGSGLGGTRAGRACECISGGPTGRLGRSGLGLGGAAYTLDAACGSSLLCAQAGR